VISPQGGYDDDAVILFSNWRSPKKQIEICGSNSANSFFKCFFFGKNLPNFQNHKTEKKKEKKGAKKKKKH
jgi:hypothetical protein